MFMFLLNDLAFKELIPSVYSPFYENITPADYLHQAISSGMSC